MLKRPDFARLRRLSRRQRIYLGGAVLTTIAGLSLLLLPGSSQYYTDTSTLTEINSEPQSETASDIDEPKPKAKPKPSPTPEGPQFIFGVGTELDQALNHRIIKEAPVKMLTSWYNGPNDLGFMNGWRTTKIPQAYAKGYSLHLIIYSNDPEKNLSTPYGPACGRSYPLSSQFLSDVKQLAQDFKGGKLYVSMFTEFQTYPCNDNTWSSGSNYYKTLKDQYLAAMKIFHQNTPGSQVSITWGGWQANWDDPGKGGGLSLLNHFADVMNASDFQSFQAMDNADNVYIIRNMTKALKPYRGKTMLAHYKPDNRSQATFDADMRNTFTEDNIAAFQADELFAFSFMDTYNMNSSQVSYQKIKSIIKTYAR